MIKASLQASAKSRCAAQVIHQKSDTTINVTLSFAIRFNPKGSNDFSLVLKHIASSVLQSWQMTPAAGADTFIHPNRKHLAEVIAAHWLFPMMRSAG